MKSSRTWLAFTPRRSLPHLQRKPRRAFPVRPAPATKVSVLGALESATANGMDPSTTGTGSVAAAPSSPYLHPSRHKAAFQRCGAYNTKTYPSSFSFSSSSSSSAAAAAVASHPTPASSLAEMKAQQSAIRSAYAYADRHHRIRMRKDKYVYAEEVRGFRAAHGGRRPTAAEVSPFTDVSLPPVTALNAVGHLDPRTSPMYREAQESLLLQQCITKSELMQSNDRTLVRCLRCFHVYGARPRELWGSRDDRAHGEGEQQSWIALEDAKLRAAQAKQLMKAPKLRKVLYSVGRRRRRQASHPVCCPKCGSPRAQWAMEYVHYRSHASTMLLIGRQPRDLLMDLARCRERDLVLIVVAARLIYVLYAVFCVYGLPLLFFLPPKALVFDSGEWLYDDHRFASLRNWDGVHFFHIARYGYTHENLHVFFPLMPLLIRATTFLTTVVFPFLHWIAPVSLYVCLVNIGASAFAGVYLRRLTLLTLLGPEAHDLVTRFNHYAEVKESRKSGKGGTRTTAAAAEEMEAETALEALVEYRVAHNRAGTMLDGFPSVLSILHANSCEDSSGAPLSTARATRMLWRVTGAALLCWIVTPSMVFTVATYTESCFSFLTFAGIYYLSRYPSPVQRKDGGCRGGGGSGGSGGGGGATLGLTFPFPEERKGGANTQGDSSSGVDRKEAERSNALPRIRWVQAYTSRDELIAVLCFAVAACCRSNAFVCSGFLLYPTAIRVLFPQLYRRRWSCTNAYHYHDDGDRARKGEAERGEGAKGGEKGSARVVRTLYPPHGRIPHPLRLLVLLGEVAIIMTPYTAMNLHGWKVYVPMWSAEEQRLIGNKFWCFYGILQKKYWNVGFLRAYTVLNSPNVMVGAPVGYVLLYGSYHYFIKPMRRGGASTPPHGAGTAKSASRWRRWLDRVVSSSMFLFVSSNMMYLWVLGLIAFTIMHVQVANRFLMSSPALYWVSGFQLVVKPRSTMTRAILLFSVVWALVGGMFFPNHLPWT